MGKLVGRVVAIAGKMRDIKGDARLEEMVEGEKKDLVLCRGEL